MAESDPPSPTRARLASEPSPAGVDHAYPGARRPDRHRWLTHHGLRLSVWEWGAEDAPPILVAHGGFDFAGTYDGFAPLLADAGWRVVSWDQRGHGDSEHPALYSWEADVRDAAAVMASAGTAPMPVLGHSKGGALILQLAESCPHMVSHVVNLDGLPSTRSWPDVPEHHRARMRQKETDSWLDHRRSAGDKVRKPGTLDDLAERRGKMDPRLDPAWLRYLVPIGAESSEDGWRWKIDPSLRMGWFGPWRPEWSMWRLPSLGMPTLCVLGRELEMMGWGTLPEDVVPNLPPGGRFVGLEGVGHFVHIEQPQMVADLVLEHLCVSASSISPVMVRHNRVDLALHHLREAVDDDVHALLVLHGLGERTPASAPPWTDGWPGPVWGLDLTGHGASSLAPGGGYTAEILMADAAIAVHHLGTATVVGRGLGAYVALLVAGACPAQVRGAVLLDGPGLAGGGPAPGSPVMVAEAVLPAGPPDPFALVEMTRDVRPPDYALSWVHQAVEGSDLETPLVVAARVRPPWLAAVADAPGVADLSLDDALALYS